jgi:hypothetical protein
MTILIHKTETSRLAHEVSKLTVKEVWDFVDELKKLEDVANTTGQGNFNFSGVKQRIAFNEYKEVDDDS